MTLKRTQVVMLPTNEKAKLIFENGILKHHPTSIDVGDKDYRNLYFLSDEEIKESDWCINPITKLPFQVKSIERNRLVYPEGCKKIIASTDSSLFVTKSIGYTYTNGKSEAFSHEKLPQPSKDFIKVYIEAYNTGTPIEWVDVEYEIGTCNCTGETPFELCINEFNTCTNSKLKVNSKNEISVKRIKDSWTREELQFMKGSSGNHLEWIYQRLIKKHGENPNYDYMIKLKELSKFVSENL